MIHVSFILFRFTGICSKSILQQAKALWLIPVLVLACHPTKISRKTKGAGFAANKVIAHRGAWKHTGAPQNSLASLKAAMAMECHGSEFDIHMTADSVLVINHDHTHAGMQVQQSTYAQLSAVKLKNGEALPLLQDFIRAGVSQRKTKLILEIKPSRRGKEWADATVSKVVGMVDRMKAGPWCVYISFDYGMLLEILRLDPDANVQYLNGDRSPEQLRADRVQGVDYNHAVYANQPGLIADARRLGLVINAWTVNDTTLMDRLLLQGADLITTDEPELLLRRTGYPVKPLESSTLRQ